MNDRNADWPIIILSLAGENARRAPLLDSLNALDLSYEVFIGVDGRHGLASNWQAEIDREGAHKRLGRYMTDGEFACALSHREIYRRILSEGWEGAVVLEDDAIIGQQFRVFIKQALYKNADIVMLYHSHARVRGATTHIMPGVQMCELAFSCSGAVGYCLNGKGAASLVAANSPVRNIADWPSEFGDVHATVLVPPLVGHPKAALSSSHLDEQRSQAAAKLRRRGPYRLMRLFAPSFWKRWFIKRLSRRVS